MKSVFFLFGLAFAEKNPLMKNAEEANNFLRLKRSPGWLDATTGAPGSKTDATTQNYQDQQDAQNAQFIDQYSLTSVETWGELKEKMEKNEDVPEEKVDELESCASKCKWEDKKESYRRGDRSIEERKENQEKCYEKSGQKDQACFAEKIIPCPKCFRYIPQVSKSGGDIMKEMTGVSGIGDVLGLLAG